MRMWMCALSCCARCVLHVVHVVRVARCLLFGVGCLFARCVVGQGFLRLRSMASSSANTSSQRRSCLRSPALFATVGHARPELRRRGRARRARRAPSGRLGSSSVAGSGCAQRACSQPAGSGGCAWRTRLSIGPSPSRCGVGDTCPPVAGGSAQRAQSKRSQGERDSER